jgi:hypothetical protein
VSPGDEAKPSEVVNDARLASGEITGAQELALADPMREAHDRL